MTPAGAPTVFVIAARNPILPSVEPTYEMTRGISGSIIVYNRDVNYAWKRR
jgi:hypothetical protein